MRFPRIDHDRCSPLLNGRGCGECLVRCPTGVFLTAPERLPLKPGRPVGPLSVFVVHRNLCIDCGTCFSACPAGAIERGGAGHV